VKNSFQNLLIISIDLPCKGTETSLGKIKIDDFANGHLAKRVELLFSIKYNDYA